jgi:hypothetical protein
LRSDEAVAVHTGIDVVSVHRFVNETVPDPDVLRRKRKSRADHYSDEEFVEALQVAARELANPMAHYAYAEWTRGRMLDDERPWPGPQGMMLRFGSWRRALARAGLPANPTGGPDPRFELSDAVDGMVEAWRALGRPPTVDAYDAWGAGRDAFPKSATARKFVDGWLELQLAAWPIVHGRQLPGIGSHDGAFEPPEAPPGQARGGGPYRRANEDSDVAPSDPFERDPQELERALGAHSRLQNALADLARDRGLEPLSPLAFDPEYDLGWRLDDGTFVLVEVKSATSVNLEGQLRLGLGQVLRYGATLSARGEKVRHVIAVERLPGDEVWVDLLARLDVQLVSPETLEEVFAAHGIQ